MDTVKKWKLLSAVLFVSLMFTGFVCYRQNQVIVKQNIILRLLWSDLLKAVDLLNSCGLSKT
jgi:hypothetical protein